MHECVVVPLASPEEDVDAKRFAPVPAGTIRIYLVRPYTQEPTKVSRVVLDGKPVAELAPLTFAVLDVAPGRHQLQVQTGDSREAALDVNATDTIYLSYQLDLLFNTTTGKLSVVPADTAQASVRQSRKVALPAGT